MLDGGEEAWKDYLIKDAWEQVLRHHFGEQRSVLTEHHELVCRHAQTCQELDGEPEEGVEAARVPAEIVGSALCAALSPSPEVAIVTSQQVWAVEQRGFKETKEHLGRQNGR